MKRKSIFLTIVVLLFAGTAFGQQSLHWPSSIDPAEVKGQDTLYFCARPDSLYPLELGYDGLKLRLHPSYGEWSLLATDGENVAGDYLVGDAARPDGSKKKNAGAGNAFKTVGSQTGGYLFQYEAKDEQCGLAEGKKFWVFVFIVPDAGDVITKDTNFCKDTNPNAVTEVNFNSVFKEKLDHYSNAGLAWAWKNGSTGKKPNVKIGEVYDTTLLDTLIITPAPNYNCGIEIRFSYTVHVKDSLGWLDPKSESKCFDDTIGKGNKNPNFYFKRDDINGSYAGQTINKPHTAWSYDATSKTATAVFRFTYLDCLGTNPRNKYVDDVLQLSGQSIQDLGYDNWGSDTVIECREPGKKDILYDFYKSSQIDYPAFASLTPPLYKPGLDENGAYWYERGLTGVDGSLTGIWGTKTPLPSLDGRAVNLDELQSNRGYHYLWRVDAGVWECLVGTASHEPDSGYIVVIIQDEIVAQDYTAQLCKESYVNALTPANKKFSLFKYTGVNTSWTGPQLNATKDSILIPTLSAGTHKYTYNIPADCGPGGDGVFYIKVTDKIKVSASKAVKYCVYRLPAMINFNDVLNIAVQGIEWELVSATVGGATITTVTGFSTDGILDILKYGTKHNGVATLKFKIKNGGECGVNNNTELTLEFVTDITI
jgi:hypothetical protein